MPRNSGGRRTGLTGSFMPGGSMRSNFKPIQDVEAKNLTVNQAASVAGDLGVTGNLVATGHHNTISVDKFTVAVQGAPYGYGDASNVGGASIGEMRVDASYVYFAVPSVPGSNDPSWARMELSRTFVGGPV